MDASRIEVHDPREHGDRIVAKLNTLLEKLDAAADRDEALIDITLQRLGAEDPELAETARLAAIPRRLDADVIGAITGQADTNRREQLLARLADLSFVERRQDGTLVYHDTVRDPMLAQMRSRADQRPAFEEASQRLIDYYADLHTAAARGARHLQLVARVIRAANPKRLAQISEAVERALIPPMLEALYHATLRDPETGYELFQYLFSIYERDQFLTACRALVVGVRTILHETAPETMEDRRFSLAFWEGRLHVAVGEFDEAEAAFRKALETPDSSLRSDTLGELGNLLKEQWRLAEASEAYQGQLQHILGEDDQAKLPHAYVALGELEHKLGNLEEAKALFAAAADAALERDSPVLPAARALFGALQLETANREAATQEILAALDAARLTRHRDHGLLSAHTLVATELFRRDAPRLVDTLAREAARLADVQGTFPDLVADFERLVAWGQLERADEQLIAVSALSEESPDDPAVADVLGVTAYLKEKQGRLDESAGLWTQLIERADQGRATPEQRARAYSERAALQIDMGKLDQARADAASAISEWKRIGHAPLVAYMKVTLAAIDFQEGRFELSERALEAAEESLLGFPELLASELLLRARVIRHRSRPDEALHLAIQSASLSLELGTIDLLPEALAEVSLIAGDLKDWQTAAAAARGAGFWAAEIAQRGAHQPSPDEIETDVLNAQAVWTYYGFVADDAAPLETARGQFVICVEREPGNLWYRLNLAYAHYALGDWEAAGDEFDRAVESAAEQLVGSAPARRAIDCRIADGAQKAVAGDVEGALRAYDIAVERLRVEGTQEERAGVVIQAGDALIRASMAAEADARFAEAETLAAEAGAPVVEAAALARRAAILAVDRDSDAEALVLLRRAVALRQREPGTPSPYWEVVGDCSSMGDRYAADSSLKHVLRALRAEPQIGVTMQVFKPQISAGLPAGWFAKESMTLLAPDGKANVIASSEPLEPGISTETYADVQGQLLEAEFPGYREFSFEWVSLLGGRQTRLRRFEWVPPDGEPVTQVQIYYVQEGRGFTTTATTPSANYQTVAIQLREVLEHVAIGQ
jgi:tetratricopeptide (TPR) repeat protein